MKNMGKLEKAEKRFVFSDLLHYLRHRHRDLLKQAQ